MTGASGHTLFLFFGMGAKNSRPACGSAQQYLGTGEQFSLPAVCFPLMAPLLGPPLPHWPVGVILNFVPSLRAVCFGCLSSQLL